uniref:Uncharacterized protein n=1 Tax=Solanum lycopersicum TaxID=4081 RepID=A0A3Q7J9R7_SOLLC
MRWFSGRSVKWSFPVRFWSCESGWLFELAARWISPEMWKDEEWWSVVAWSHCSCLSCCMRFCWPKIMEKTAYEQ